MFRISIYSHLVLVLYMATIYEALYWKICNKTELNLPYDDKLLHWKEQHSYFCTILSQGIFTCLHFFHCKTWRKLFESVLSIVMSKSNHVPYCLQLKLYLQYLCSIKSLHFQLEMISSDQVIISKEHSL